MLYSTELTRHMVGSVGVEPTFSDFQSGTPTAYVNFPYGIPPRIRTLTKRVGAAYASRYTRGTYVLEESIGVEPI